MTRPGSAPVMGLPESGRVLNKVTREGMVSRHTISTERVTLRRSEVLSVSIDTSIMGLNVTAPAFKPKQFNTPKKSYNREISSSCEHSYLKIRDATHCKNIFHRDDLDI